MLRVISEPDDQHLDESLEVGSKAGPTHVLAYDVSDPNAPAMLSDCEVDVGGRRLESVWFEGDRVLLSTKDRPLGRELYALETDASGHCMVATPSDAPVPLQRIAVAGGAQTLELIETSSGARLSLLDGDGPNVLASANVARAGTVSVAEGVLEMASADGVIERGLLAMASVSDADPDANAVELFTFSDRSITARGKLDRDGSLVAGGTIPVLATDSGELARIEIAADAQPRAHTMIGLERGSFGRAFVFDHALARVRLPWGFTATRDGRAVSEVDGAAVPPGTLELLAPDADRIRPR